MICQHVAPIYVTLASVDPVWGWGHVCQRVLLCCCVDMYYVDNCYYVYVTAWTCNTVCITDAMHAIQMDTTLELVHVCRRLLNEENENVSTNPRGGSCYMQCYCVLHSNTRT